MKVKGVSRKGKINRDEKSLQVKHNTCPFFVIEYPKKIHLKILDPTWKHLAYCHGQNTHNQGYRAVKGRTVWIEISVRNLTIKT